LALRHEAWALFDAIVGDAAGKGLNPWCTTDPDDDRSPHTWFEPDFATLARLLAVPVALNATSQSGVPALAFDVWTAFEFRRAGFDPEALWPRAVAPRLLSPEIVALIAAVPRDLRRQLVARIEGGVGGVASANATVLGKNYVKQVDVGMSSWRTGPELLVSTKRMDSSFAKNAANRVEESYGDAKNLRLRHPRAALGFVYGLRSTALTQDPDKTEWLCDLLIKLGREDDAYDAVALVIPEWDNDTPLNDHVDAEPSPSEDALVAAGLVADQTADAGGDALDLGLPEDLVAARLGQLPEVRLRHDAVPGELGPGRFFDLITRRVLDNSPVNFHTLARRRIKEPRIVPLDRASSAGR
jgi:hypothetical protein